MENKSIYHYTGSLGLLGIIKDQTIRCTNLKFLNDREEYNYLYSVYVKRHKDDTNGLLGRDAYLVVMVDRQIPPDDLIVHFF